MTSSNLTKNIFKIINKNQNFISNYRFLATNAGKFLMSDQNVKKTEFVKCLKCQKAWKRKESVNAKSMMDIGIRKIFNTEHDLFRESARKFFKEEVEPYHKKWEKSGKVSRELWKKAGNRGLLGVTCPDKYGGISADWMTACVILEEQAYSNFTGPGFRMHSNIVIPYIAKYGTEDQKKKLLPALIGGEYIGSLAMSEPNAGSDVQGIKTTAKKDGKDWILNGSKTFISNGCHSDIVIVVAITNTESKSPAHGTSLFILEDGMDGFSKGKVLEKIGLKAQDTCDLFFDDVRLPSSALLGEINKGFYYLMKELPQERLSIGVTATASCEFMFEETRKYVNERKAFGKTLFDLQTIQHKMAELKTEIVVARGFTDHLISLHHNKQLDSQLASMAKYWLTDLQNRVAYDCLQLHGGWGYMWDYPIAKAFCDSRVQPIYGGSNEIMKELIARSISLKI